MTDKVLLREVADRGAPPAGRNQLQRFDWLLEALGIFVAEGIDAVRITRLAEELGVTRGSFYWHFSNRDDLLDALVAYWRDKNTRAIVEAVDGAASLTDGILRFFEACVDHTLFDSRLDLAIREWARRSGAVDKQMRAADEIRIQALSALFSRSDYPMPEAFVRARVIYFAQIGFYALDVKEPMSTRLGYTEAYFAAFTGKPISRREAQAFRQRMLEKHGST